MKETKPYWYPDMAHAMGRYFVCLIFPNLSTYFSPIGACPLLATLLAVPDEHATFIRQGFGSDGKTLVGI